MKQTLNLVVWIADIWWTATAIRMGRSSHMDATREQRLCISGSLGFIKGNLFRCAPKKNLPVFSLKLFLRKICCHFSSGAIHFVTKGCPGMLQIEPMGQAESTEVIVLANSSTSLSESVPLGMM